jgi:tetratricopeptide (TPR) repeat protein
MLAAYAAMWRIRRSAQPFPAQELCQELSQALGVRHCVDILAAEGRSMPMAFGVLRSSIFMPCDALEWSDEHRRIVLLHELAHVRRDDVATHLLARTAAALYWWNPLAWIALRESLKECERAADDLVLNLGTRASEYAGHLLDVARNMQAPPLGSLAVAMARRSQLEGRLTAILDPKIDRRAPGRASALIAAALAVGMIAPLAAIRAQDTQTPVIPADVDAAIRAAVSQKNHEVLENAAQAAEQLRKYDTAQRLLQSAADIRADVSGRQSVDYGLGLLKLGDLESKRNLVESATDFYSRAAEVLGDRPEAARALMYLGTAAVLKVDYPKAIDFFQHAQRIDPAHSGIAVMWMAVVQKLEKNTDEAETLFKNALSLQDPNSPEAVVYALCGAQHKAYYAVLGVMLP